jgi:hypothetical protein
MSPAHLALYTVAAIVAALVAWLINYFGHPTWFSPKKALAALLTLLLVAALVQYLLQDDNSAARRPLTRTSETQRQTSSAEPTASSIPPSTGASPPEATSYLADLVPQSNQSFTSGAASLSGKAYPQSALISCFYRNVYAEYNLGKNRSTLSAEVGLDDKVPSDSIAYVMIYADNRLLGEAHTVKSGSPLPLVLNVRNVLHLKFVCSPKEGQEGRFRLVLGDARVS